MHIRDTIAAFLLGTSMLAVSADIANAQTGEAAYSFDLPAQDLNTSLRRVGQQAGHDVLFEADVVAGKKAPALHGAYTLKAALDVLLRRSGLDARIEGGAVIIKGRSQAALAQDGAAPTSDIVVTGSHIVGAQSTAVVTTVTAEDMRNAGQNDLGEMARSLPQNFGGGQNPGIGNTQGTANLNANVNGASTFNLRGVGNAATLTLLNGNRLSYSGISGAVDISTIPISAVERVEVVTDGSSAVYGADAVAGVVNIILKPDYQGWATSARLGGATDGGDFEQQYSLVGGRKWNTGGFIGTYDYSRNTAITAGERGTYNTTANPQTDIYPDISRHSALLSLHQSIGDDVTFQSDVVYKNGRQDKSGGYLINQPITYQGYNVRAQFTSFGLAPSVDVKLGRSWTAKVSSFYGRDTTNAFTNLYYYGGLYSQTAVRYAYDTQAGEVGLQGPLLTLPAGDLRLAVGGGVRSYRLEANNNGILIDQRLTNYFGYVEANVPIISPLQAIPFVYRVSLTAAMRFEGYSGSDQVTTPKISLAYEPVQTFRLTASWGRSFKLPTLYQRYQGYATVLDPVSGYGTAYPSNASMLVALGANVNQHAERSENWDVGVEWKPLRGLTISSDYFHIDYHDRVATPISSIAGILTNPIYASFITTSPSAALLSQYINGAIGGLQNATTQPYSAANVVAIVDDRDVNISRQVFQGVDLSARYHLALAGKRALDLTGTGTWIYSRQQLVAGLPWTSLAGTIFNPPHFKARVGASYAGKAFSVSSFINYIGGVTDNRRTVPVRVGDMTTWDLTGRVSLASLADISINAINLLNAKPKQIYTTSPYDTSFDTTNYSAVGRFLGLTLSRNW